MVYVEMNEWNKNEFVKITLEKFYRITGKSNQYIGLVPDVEIPTLLDEQMPREKTNPSALKNDEIDIKLKYQLFKNNNYSNAIQNDKLIFCNNFEDFTNEFSKTDNKNNRFELDLNHIRIIWILFSFVIAVYYFKKRHSRFFWCF